MIDPSEKEITTKEMLDTLEHCRTNMTLSEVQAYAGKWTGKDNEIMDAIRRLIEGRGEWERKIRKYINDETLIQMKNEGWGPGANILKEIRDFDFGKEKP